MKFQFSTLKFEIMKWMEEEVRSFKVNILTKFFEVFEHYNVGKTKRVQEEEGEKLSHKPTKIP